MTVEPRVTFLKVDERLYLDAMAFEAGMRELADEFEADGDEITARVLRGIWDDVWLAVEEANA